MVGQNRDTSCSPGPRGEPPPRTTQRALGRVPCNVWLSASRRRCCLSGSEDDLDSAQSKVEQGEIHHQSLPLCRVAAFSSHVQPGEWLMEVSTCVCQQGGGIALTILGRAGTSERWSWQQNKEQRRGESVEAGKPVRGSLSQGSV